VVGVVYDPFLDELWTATVGKPARLNGRSIAVSSRSRLRDAIITVGFAKHQDSLERMLPVFSRLLHRVLKLRIMGSAALGLSYIATGRFDGYVESGLRLWDIAAGALVIVCAGGRCECKPVPGDHRYALLASNGGLHKALARLARR
jgi:myo-inositol-1(or 4)-monophosphatase